MITSIKPKRIHLIGLAMIFFLSCLAPAIDTAHAATIVGSKHDFSSFNTQQLGGFAGNFQVQNASGFPMLIDEVCVFCHTPHGASRVVSGLSTSAQWLWNRVNSPPAGFSYSMYSSSTLSATIAAAPTGVSMMCMSCHDGVTSIAVNTLLNAPGSGNGAVTTLDGSSGAIGNIYNGTPFVGWGPNLGETYPGGPGTINLSNDHPISFEWPTNKPGLLSAPSDSRLRLFGLSGQRMECATCHAVHDPTIIPFLAMSNTNSNMCRACHLK